MGYIGNMGVGDVIGYDATHSILILGSGSDRGKLEKAPLRLRIHLERTTV